MSQNPAAEDQSMTAALADIRKTNRDLKNCVHRIHQIAIGILIFVGVICAATLAVAFKCYVD